LFIGIREGVGDLLHSIRRCDNGDSSASSYDQTEISRLVSDNSWILGVSEMLDRSIQYQIQQLIVTLEDKITFSTALEFDSNFLIEELGQVNDRLFLLALTIILLINHCRPAT
ncbi:hypothetical protein PENTCL1PPCAC_17735, partial [Pristionchus entomophagus]